MIVDPPDGKVPLQPWAMEKRTEIMAHQDKVEYLDPRVRCLQSGLPRANLPVGYNTYQYRPDSRLRGAALRVEPHVRGYIPLDGRPHISPKIRLPMGDSRGRWEGNTLVVDVTNFTDRTWVVGHGAPPEGAPASSLTTGHGVFHTEALHVVERFTLIDADTIRYEATDRRSQRVHAAVEDSTSMPSPGRPPIISCSSMRAMKATAGTSR